MRDYRQASQRLQSSRLFADSFRRHRTSQSRRKDDTFLCWILKVAIAAIGFSLLRSVGFYTLVNDLCQLYDRHEVVSVMASS